MAMFLKVITSLSPFICCVLVATSLLPGVTAAPRNMDAFPDVTFKAFSKFISNNFSSKISLASVLIILFTLTNNPDVLNLHTRQQIVKHPKETKKIITGWMNSLVRALQHQLGTDAARLLQHEEKQEYNSEAKTTNAIALKLDAMITLLDLNPFNSKGDCKRKTCFIDDSVIQLAILIYPQSMECETELSEYFITSKFPVL